METKTVIYPGSFHPFTYGHLSILCSALCLFDKVIVAVGNNTDKQYLCFVQERMDLVKNSIEDFLILYENRLLNGRIFTDIEKKAIKRLNEDPSIVDIISYDDLTVDAAIWQGAIAQIRGERIVGDHDNEMSLHMFNKELLEVRHYPLVTVTIPVADERLSYVSSSKFNEQCKWGEYASALKNVTPSVHNFMMGYYLRKPFMEMMKVLDVSEFRARETFEQLRKQYLSPQRKYSNFTRIAYALNILNQLQNVADVDTDYLSAALFFRDYNKTETNKTIPLNVNQLKALGFASGAATKIANLIKFSSCNRKKSSVCDSEICILHDLDFVELGDRYNCGIFETMRQVEYRQSHSKELYNTLRSMELKNILKKQNLYYSADFRKEYLEDATYNMRCLSELLIIN